MTRDTFNAITVDGECSTNDTVFAMASGASGVVIDESLYPALEAGLRAVSKELAIGIVRGGEGATKLVTHSRHRREGMGARRTRGAHDRQLAAREDRRARRRSELGPACGGGRPLRRAVRALARGGPHRRHRAVRERAAARRRTPRRRRPICPARTSTSKSTSAPAAPNRPRSGRAISAPSTSESTRTTGHRHALTHRFAPKDFLSVLDFEPAELEACLALAARVKRERALGKKAPTANALGGAHVALLFEKPSLRTISTFEIAVRELGGDVITPYPGRGAQRARACRRRRPQSRALGQVRGDANLRALDAARVREGRAAPSRRQRAERSRSIRARRWPICRRSRKSGASGPAARSRSSATATTSRRRSRRAR